MHSKYLFMTISGRDVVTQFTQSFTPAEFLKASDVLCKTSYMYLSVQTNNIKLLYVHITCDQY